MSQSVKRVYCPNTPRNLLRLKRRVARKGPELRPVRHRDLVLLYRKERDALVQAGSTTSTWAIPSPPNEGGAAPPSVLSERPALGVSKRPNSV